jgi:hypothetical protein
MVMIIVEVAKLRLSRSLPDEPKLLVAHSEGIALSGMANDPAINVGDTG